MKDEKNFEKRVKLVPEIVKNKEAIKTSNCKFIIILLILIVKFEVILGYNNILNYFKF